MEVGQSHASVRVTNEGSQVIIYDVPRDSPACRINRGLIQASIPARLLSPTQYLRSSSQIVRISLPIGRIIIAARRPSRLVVVNFEFSTRRIIDARCSARLSRDGFLTIGSSFPRVSSHVCFITYHESCGYHVEV